MLLFCSLYYMMFAINIFGNRNELRIYEECINDFFLAIYCCRLAAYERNAGFSRDVCILPQASLPDWPTEGFQQITDDHQQTMPPLSKEAIEEYFVTRQLKDSLPSGDIKGVELGKELLKSKRIQAISIHLHHQDIIYFSGLVAAAMKKNLRYSIKLKVSADGQLINSECECPAGKGPTATCKHIACIALLLVEFRIDGTVPAQKTCTEILQTFHQPKQINRGPPYKIEKMTAYRKQKLNYPRTGPGARKNCHQYNDTVRNKLINFKPQTGMHLSYLDVCSGRADIQAASEDHLYCKEPLTHYMVEQHSAVTAQVHFSCALYSALNSYSKA